MTQRAYLNARKTRDPRAARAHAVKVLTDWEDLKIQTALGAQFNVRGRVVLRRPWWMPAPLFWALLRSIVVERRVTERHRS